MVKAARRPARATGEVVYAKDQTMGAKRQIRWLARSGGCRLSLRLLDATTRRESQPAAKRAHLGTRTGVPKRLGTIREGMPDESGVVSGSQRRRLLSSLGTAAASQRADGMAGTKPAAVTRQRARTALPLTARTQIEHGLAMSAGPTPGHRLRPVSRLTPPPAKTPRRNG